MTRPEVKVEIAFNAGYATPAASRTWTDVTSYVLQMSGINLEHGRRDEYSVAEFNSLSLTLNNTDGRFTPGRAASPYSPNVKLGRPIRVTATPHGQAASVRFDGYVDAWPVEWPGIVETYAECRISARSRIGRLGRGIELRSLLEEEILVDDPVAYYTLGDAEGASAAYDSSGFSAAPMLVAGSGAAVTFGSAEGPVTDSLTAASFSAGRFLSLAAPPAYSAAEFFVQRNGVPAGGELVALMQGTGTYGGVPITSVGLVISAGAPSGHLIFMAFEDLGLGSVAGANDFVTPASICDNTPHHVMAYWDSAAHRMKLRLDGAEYTSGGFAFDFTPSGPLKIGGTTPNAFTTNLIGSIAHVALHASTPTLARAEAHSSAGLTGHADDTAAERLTRYATFARVPSAELDFETGALAGLAHIDTSGKTALAAMREVEQTEGGVLFDARDGTLTFHDRAHRYATTAALTLDVNAGEISPAYAPSLDDVALRNDVTASGAGVTARVTDTLSIDDHGAYRESLDLATTDPDEPYQRASWVVGNYAEPAVRVATLTVELTRLSPARQAAVLALTVGDKVTVTNLMGQSDTTTKTFFVEGYAETAGSATHSLAFNVSPAEVNDVWILGDATYGVLDTTTRLGY